ncbi:MAG TPA: long-chain fatty acid--CoA ligase [Candidatus Baltobacteraceae bacterium]|nr:long-chain fatty acid--CoA ligase [Candidatus Baltobacteraceae bacterium]
MIRADAEQVLSTSSTLAAFVAERLAAPRAVALAERRDGRTRALSSAQVHRQAAAVAHALRARGVARGDRVAIVAENSVEWLLADFGILYAGAVVVPVFATVAPDQLRYILTDSETKLVFVDTPDRGAALRSALGEGAPPVVVFEGDANDAFDAFLAEGERRAGDDALLRSYTGGIAADELAVLIYTSGTTGTPKGVMLSHGNLVADVESAFDPQDSTLRHGEIALSVLPLAHIFEHTDALGYLHNGLQHYVTTPERLLDDMREVRPAYVAFVPRIFERLIAGIVGNAQQAGGLKARLVPWALETGAAYQRAIRDGSPSLALRARYALARTLVLRRIPAALGLDRLKFFVSGSAPLHRDTALTLAAMGLVVCEGYGLTETAPVVTVNRPADNVLGTVGPPVRGVQVRIADDGEVLVKGSNVMLGYYKLPREEQPFDADGWFCTGDIGELDSRGHLKITDRKREVFKTSGGKWISPSRIETAIKRSVSIAQVMAFGANMPHPGVLVAPNWGYVRAALGLPETMTTAAMARDARVREHVTCEVELNTADLAAFERVRRVAILPRDLTIEDGELSPTLKVKRRVVEQRYASLIAEAYAEDLHARAPRA